MQVNPDIAKAIKLLFRGTQGLSIYTFLLIIVSIVGRMIVKSRTQNIEKNGLRWLDGLFIILIVGIFFILQSKIDAITIDLNNQNIIPQTRMR